MPLYRYTVEDKSGRALNGVMQATDESDLARRLSTMGYVLKSVAAAGGAAVSSALPATKTATRASGGQIPPSLEPRVPIGALATCLRQMAAFIRSGMTPYQAAVEILPRTRNSRLRRALKDIERQIQAGGALSPVMTAHPDVFPTKLVGLIYCGEVGGFLDVALDEAASSVEDEHRRHRVPRLVAGFLRLNLIGLFLGLPLTRIDLVLSRVAALSKPDDTGSRAVGNAGRALWEAYLAGATLAIGLTVVFVAATYAWPHIKRIPSLRLWMDGFLLRMPVWGPLQTSLSLSRFGKSLGQLYNAGISPGVGWAAASATCPNSVIANKIRAAGGVLSAGGPFSTAVEEAGVFDENATALLISGERAGDIPGMLQKVTEAQEDVSGAHSTKGRWLSTSLAMSSLIAMTGVIAILAAKYYVDSFGKILEALGLGGTGF